MFTKHTKCIYIDVWIDLSCSAFVGMIQLDCSGGQKNGHINLQQEKIQSDISQQVSILFSNTNSNFGIRSFVTSFDKVLHSESPVYHGNCLCFANKKLNCLQITGKKRYECLSLISCEIMHQRLYPFGNNSRSFSSLL